MSGERDMALEMERNDNGPFPTERDTPQISSIERAGFARGEGSSLFAAFLSTHLKKDIRGSYAPFTETRERGSPTSARPALAQEQGEQCVALWTCNERVRERRHFPSTSQSSDQVPRPPYDAA